VTNVTFTNLTASFADRYRIERELGTGGMATVYLASDLRHDRKVAIKVLKPELAAVLGAERFVVEIKTTAALQHPHILPLFDSGTADGLLFYVMPYIQGETIRERLNRETQFGVDEAVRITREVADALDYAHRHGVIHRDIKPENILLHDGRAMVMDFGIALAVSAAAGGRMTETGLSLGTPHYMSPEQATAEKEITPRSDIYSLASVLYEMLAGQPPHVGGAAQQVIMRIITEPARPVNEFRKTVPPNVVAAVARALEKLPADRFDSARAFGDALANAGFSHATSAAPTASAMAAEARRRWNVREIVPWSVAAVAIAGWGWYATRRPPVPAPGRFAIDLPDSVSPGPTGTSYGRLAISRDGSALVIVGRSERASTNMLYLRRATDPVATPIRGTEGANSPSFSPSGDAIVFASKVSLRRVPTTGGAPQTLATVKDSVGGGITYSSWGDDGTIIYQVGGALGKLMAVSANGGDPRTVATTDTMKRVFQLRQPEVLPGSKYALVSFVRGVLTANAAPDSVRLGLISLADGSLTDLGLQGAEPHYVAPGYVLFNRGPVVMLAPFSLRKRSFTGPAVRVLEDVVGVNAVTADFAVSQNGMLAYQGGGGGALAARSTLWVVDMRGGGHSLDTEGKNVASPTVSPDGKRIVLEVRQSRPRIDIWTMDLTSGALRPLTSGFRNTNPVWSRDGSRIYYIKNPGTSLMARAADGAGAESTVVAGAQANAFTPGPTHGYSLFTTLPPDDLIIAPTDSLKAVRPFVATPGSERRPDISPNGRWVAYMSDASGRYEVVVRPLPGPGAEVPVSVSGGETPRWAPDGRTLYYRGSRHMMAARIAEQPRFVVTKQDTLFVDNFAHGPGNEFSVFPDGQHFLMVQRGQTKAELFMVINWQQLIGPSSGADRGATTP